MSMRARRQNIVQPHRWWKAFREAAEQEDISLSEWIGNACLAALPETVRDKLPQVRPPANRPKQPARKK